jgi:N-acetylmuramoyl-L-alanine amidase
MWLAQYATRLTAAGAAPGARQSRRYHEASLPRPTAFLLIALLVVVGSSSPSQTQSPGGLRVVTREGQRSLPIVTLNNQEYVALDEVASMFGLTLREDRLAGGITATAGTRSVIITPDQPVVSVAARLVSLSTAPVRQGNRWLVPLDFLQRAVGPALDTRIELRRASRLAVVGDVRVPRVTVRVEPGAAGTTLVADITPATPQRIVSEGNRLTISFDADALDLTLPTVAGGEFIQSIQPGDAASIRVTTGPKFGVHRATTSQSDANSSRLTLELMPAGSDPPAPPPSATPPPAPPADPLPLATPAVGVRTLVIDPGHGGDEPGARGGAGAVEKEITLSIARRLRTIVESRLGLRVFLTRDDDRTMSLDNRAAYANSQRADVFLSIHVNAALGPTLRGAEVYYLAAEAADAGQDEEDASAVLPSAFGGGTRRIDLVRWEAAQSRHLKASASLAGIMEQALRGRVEMSPRPVQQAPFRVLVGAAMPAVVIEVGYLSNPEQEQALLSGGYQDRIAQALFDGLVQFRAQTERSAAGGAPQP